MNEDKEIKNEVLEAIKKGGIKMIPRWQFVLKAILLVLGIALAFLTLLYLMSFIFFTLNRSGMLFAPSFGSRGIFILIRSLPWMLILLSMACIGLLEVLVKKYSFAYRNPIIYSILGIMALALVTGVIAAPFHGPPPGMHRGGGPGTGRFPGLEYKRPDQIHRGTILELTSSGFILDYLDNGTSSVLIDERTRRPDGMDLATSSNVIVFGSKEGREIRAFGIRVLSE